MVNSDGCLHIQMHPAYMPHKLTYMHIYEGNNQHNPTNRTVYILSSCIGGIATICAGVMQSYNIEPK